MTTKAIIYGAKSTEDRHGSIPTQIEDCRALAAREGWDVVGEYQDEAKSAYHGNRGPGLVKAKAHAEREGAVLVVQHSDRLARGDGLTADHLGEIIFWARRAGVMLRSVQDPQTFENLMLGVMMGERNNDDSKRKSASVRDGLRRRKEKGKPVGPVPLGYTVERTVIDDEVVTKRVVDPPAAATVERIFAMVERGMSFGDVARALNAEGITGRRGNPWVRTTIRTVVNNTAYAGDKGYEAIIEPEQFRTVHAHLERMDPAAVKRRAGGRKPADTSFFLRGVVFCSRCGGALYCLTPPQSSVRTYFCGTRRQGKGLCDAPAIPAGLLESHVLNHLDAFVGSVESWIAEQVDARTVEHDQRVAAVDRELAVLRELDRQRERHLAAYRAMVADGDRLARYGLEEVERLDHEREAQERVIAKAEAVVAEWIGPPDVNAALDFYNDLLDLVQGKVRQARGTVELNQVLSTILTGLWAEVEPDRDRLLVEFELRGATPNLPGGQPIIFDRRATLPPRRLADLTVEPITESELPPSPWSASR